MLPNLNKCLYACGKFSKPFEGIIYLWKSNGEIDTFDLLDENHKQ